MLSRDDKDRFAKIIREQVCEPDGWGIYKAGTLQRCDRAVAELEAAGAFTPDQPAAPDEDAAVRELIHAFWIEGGTVRKDIAIAYAKRILAAGYRRPVDTRPKMITMTVSEFKGWPPMEDVDMLMASVTEPMILTPDPAPAAEVPVVEVTLPTDARELIATWLWQVRDEDGIRQVDYDDADDLIAALTKATDR